MRTLTKTKFKKDIIDCFELNSKLTIAEAKEQIAKQILTDQYNTDIKVGNIRVFYTDNCMYCGGASNGHGRGYYISNVSLMGGNEIKI